MVSQDRGVVGQVIGVGLAKSGGLVGQIRVVVGQFRGVVGQVRDEVSQVTELVARVRGVFGQIRGVGSAKFRVWSA